MKTATRLLFTTSLCVASLPGALIGTLNFAGDVNVSVNGVGTTFVNFLPTANPNGDILAGTSNSGSFAPINGATALNRLGKITDFSSLTVFSINNWLQFALLPAPFSTMNVRLDGLTASAASVGCGAVALNASCTPFAGSIFTFVNDPAGAVVSFRGFGRVIDGADSNDFTVLFSTQFVAQTPNQVITLASSVSGAQTSYSASLSTVPEPSTWALALLGVSGVFLARRRR